MPLMKIVKVVDREVSRLFFVGDCINNVVIYQGCCIVDWVGTVIYLGT